MAAWVCGRCGRRVPSYVDACHCGAGRENAAGASGDRTATPAVGPPGRFNARDVPWPVWTAVGVATLAVLGGAVSLLLPHEREYIAPLLGYVDRLPSPQPRPSSTPRPTPSVAPR